MRDLSLERYSPMREQHYQSTISNISNGRVKPTQPPTVPQDYFNKNKSRLSPGRINILLIEIISLDIKEIINHLTNLNDVRSGISNDRSKTANRSLLNDKIHINKE